jgi:hypothetical protein
LLRLAVPSAQIFFGDGLTGIFLFYSWGKVQQFIARCHGQTRTWLAERERAATDAEATPAPTVPTPLEVAFQELEESL